MTQYVEKGNQIRLFAKELVLEFLEKNSSCAPESEGMRMKQAQIFRKCGLDWGDYQSATSSNQQYWIVALLRELEKEGKVERLPKSAPWRLTKTLDSHS